jgi:iron complex transport system substrate-binding protein
MLSVLCAACAAPATDGIVDQVGNPVEIGAHRRVVALAPDVTELAFAVGAGSSIVAVPATADFPAAAKALPHIDPGDVEAVLARAPDLVLATTAGNDPRLVERLRQLRVPVCTVDVTSFARLVEAVRLVGEVTGRPADAAALATDLSRRVDAARSRAAGLAVLRGLYVVWWDPLIVAAPGTFPDDLLRAAGLRNAAPAAAGRYPRIDPEVLLDPSLDVVVAPDEPDVRATFETMRRRPVADRLRGGRMRLIWLPADLANRPGPRLVDALEHLVREREAMP